MYTVFRIYTRLLGVRPMEGRPSHFFLQATKGLLSRHYFFSRECKRSFPLLGLFKTNNVLIKFNKDSKAKGYMMYRELSSVLSVMNCRQSWLLSCLSEKSCRRCMYRYARATRTLRAAATLLALHADELAVPCIKPPEVLLLSFSPTPTLV